MAHQQRDEELPVPGAVVQRVVVERQWVVVRQLLPLLLRYRLGFFPRFELVQGLDLSSNTSNIQSLRRLRLVDRRRRRTNTLAGHYLVRLELFRL